MQLLKHKCTAIAKLLDRKKCSNLIVAEEFFKKINLLEIFKSLKASDVDLLVSFNALDQSSKRISNKNKLSQCMTSKSFLQNEYNLSDYQMPGKPVFIEVLREAIKSNWTFPGVIPFIQDRMSLAQIAVVPQSIKQVNGKLIPSGLYSTNDSEYHEFIHLFDKFVEEFGTPLSEEELNTADTTLTSHTLLCYKSAEVQELYKLVVATQNRTRSEDLYNLLDEEVLTKISSKESKVFMTHMDFDNLLTMSQNSNRLPLEIVRIKKSTLEVLGYKNEMDIKSCFSSILSYLAESNESINCLTLSVADKLDKLTKISSKESKAIVYSMKHWKQLVNALIGNPRAAGFDTSIANEFQRRLEGNKMKSFFKTNFPEEYNKMFSIVKTQRQVIIDNFKQQNPTTHLSDTAIVHYILTLHEANIMLEAYKVIDRERLTCHYRNDGVRVHENALSKFESILEEINTTLQNKYKGYIRMGIK